MLVNIVPPAPRLEPPVAAPLDHPFSVSTAVLPKALRDLLGRQNPAITCLDVRSAGALGQRDLPQILGVASEEVTRTVLLVGGSGAVGYRAVVMSATEALPHAQVARLFDAHVVRVASAGEVDAHMLGGRQNRSPLTADVPVVVTASIASSRVLAVPTGLAGVYLVMRPTAFIELVAGQVLTAVEPTGAPRWAS